MYKNATYQEKFNSIKDWMPAIVDVIKRDLKNDHLRNDLYFVKTFFASKNLNKITNDELSEAYLKALASEAKSEEIGDFITSRWLLKNTDLYDLFERRLSKLNPDFTSIEELDLAASQEIAKDAVNAFGATKTYIFAVLNAVVFPEAVFKQLRDQAIKELKSEKTHQETVAEKMSIEKMQQVFERDIARLTDKYEKKLSGMQKKYLVDVESLKKQIATLQKKLQG